MFGTDHAQSETCWISIISHKNIYIITFLYYLFNGKKDANTNFYQKN